MEMRLRQLKKEHAIRLERNDAKVVRWMSNIKPEDTISAEEFRTRLRLTSMREFYRIENCDDLVI